MSPDGKKKNMRSKSLYGFIPPATMLLKKGESHYLILLLVTRFAVRYAATVSQSFHFYVSFAELLFPLGGQFLLCAPIT
jgi:hypothetical protein